MRFYQEWFLGWEINLYSQAIGLLAEILIGWLNWPNNGIVLKIRSLSLCSKIIGLCHFEQNFPPVSEMISKIQSDPSLGYGYFSSNSHRKYPIFVYVEKYLNITILFNFSPDVFENSIRPYFQKIFGWLFEKISPDFKGPFLHCKTYSLQYWTRLPSVNPSVPQSVHRNLPSLLLEYLMKKMVVFFFLFFNESVPDV